LLEKLIGTKKDLILNAKIRKTAYLRTNLQEPLANKFAKIGDKKCRKPFQAIFQATTVLSQPSKTSWFVISLPFLIF
jgi:hypothetical protein